MLSSPEASPLPDASPPELLEPPVFSDELSLDELPLLLFELSSLFEPALELLLDEVLYFFFLVVDEEEELLLLDELLLENTVPLYPL